MGISVGTIFKWYNPDDLDEDGEPIENCLDGQCVGIVTEITKPDTSDEPLATVKFWQMCEYHARVDQNGTGPYGLAYIWQIGELY